MEPEEEAYQDPIKKLSQKNWPGTVGELQYETVYGHKFALLDWDLTEDYNEDEPEDDEPEEDEEESEEESEIAEPQVKEDQTAEDEEE